VAQSGELSAVGRAGRAARRQGPEDHHQAAGGESSGTGARRSGAAVDPPADAGAERGGDGQRVCPQTRADTRDTGTTARAGRASDGGSTGARGRHDDASPADAGARAAACTDTRFPIDAGRTNAAGAGRSAETRGRAPAAFAIRFACPGAHGVSHPESETNARAGARSIGRASAVSTTAGHLDPTGTHGPRAKAGAVPGGRPASGAPREPSGTDRENDFGTDAPSRAGNASGDSAPAHLQYAAGQRPSSEPHARAGGRDQAHDPRKPSALPRARSERPGTYGFDANAGLSGDR